MTNVYQACYTYTETFCHPDPSEWETLTKVLCTTLDESYAKELMDKHNASPAAKDGLRKAYIKVFELTGR